MHNLLEILILVLRKFTKLPVLRYLCICNVLYIWHIRVIPTYRVYQLYDYISGACDSTITWHCVDTLVCLWTGLSYPDDPLHLVLLAFPSLSSQFYTNNFHYHIVHRVRMSAQGGTFQQQLVMVGIVYYRLYFTHTRTHRLVISTYREELGPSCDGAQGLLLMFQL